jgi:putative ABC transport system permease protein
MLQRNRKLSDFSAEIDAHLEMEVERLRELGMSEEEARRAARLAFGNVTRVQERFVEATRWLWLDQLCRDIRFGFRTLARRPMVAVVALLTLALGIGANTAIFSAVYLVMLKPLPFRDADHLIFVRQQNLSRGFKNNNISPPEILAWRRDSGAFEDLAAYTPRSCVLTGDEDAEEYPCEIVSSNLFPLLGATPFLGRVFISAEDEEGGRPVAILSYQLWQRRFGEDIGVLGRAIQISGKTYTVVGVMPANFSHLYASPYGESPALWLSGIALSPAHVWNDYFGVGRLKPGISLEQAARQMDQVSTRLEYSIPGIKGWRAEIETLRANTSGDSRLALTVLMAGVAFVLLIACANVANLLLAQSAGRAKEFAIRSALGGRVGQIVRQLLTESLILSLSGGILGVLLACCGCRGLAALAPPFLLHSAPGLKSGAMNAWVLAFALFMVVGTTILFGLAPALRSAQPQLLETLKDTGQSSLASPRSRRLRSALIVSEIAIAMVLLVAAGLMIRTLASLRRVDLGLRPEAVLALHVPLIGDRYKEPQSRVDFWQRVVTAVSDLPGVQAVSVSRGLPVGDWAGQYFTTSDEPNPPAEETPSADYVVAGPEYFRALGIPVRQGRAFAESDTQSTEKVAIVSQELARLYWLGKDPIGKKLRVGSPPSSWLTVVGVCADVRSQGPDEPPTSAIYIPYRQYPWLLGGPQHLLVRAKQGVTPESLERAIVQEIHRVDKDEPVTDIAPLQKSILEPMAEQRMVMVLLVSFAGLALILSALGIYSVFSYSIAQQTREIGVRLALGARRGKVLWLVIGGSLRLSILGIGIGTVASLALTRLMTHLLFGVSTMDLATLGSVALLLTVTGVFASSVPARRAMRIDPNAALRYE